MYKTLTEHTDTNAWCGKRDAASSVDAFYQLILATMAGGIVVAYVDEWRLGVRIIGAALGLAAELRLVLPQRDAVMLAVRHRLVDVAILAGIGAALVFLAGDIPGPTV